MSKKTGRSVILKVLSDNPDGLPNAKLYELVKEEYAVERNSLAQIMCHLATEGLVVRVGRHCCKHCGRESTIYKKWRG